MKLSENLSLAECTKSLTAKRLGINNEPDEWVTENLRQTAVNVFQPVRECLGVPIHVSSGYRSAELNKAIGGSVRSQHVQGRALDLDADVYGTCTNAEIFNYIRQNLEFDQLIWEYGTEDNPDWVHVSFVRDGVNRRRCLKACRDDEGKTYFEVIFGKGL